MNGFRFNLWQHPVGQGGFHTGSLVECGDSPSCQPVPGAPEFRWAYDCGSNQVDELNQEIKVVAGTEFDVLFLSHLDSDHVNGVDKLLANSGVKEVVLPHLDNVDWVLHLAAGINDGTISGTFVDLASDPAGWFGRRGVERLTYVETDRDDREGGPPQGPLAPIDHRKERGERKEGTEFIWANKTGPVTYQATPGSSHVSMLSIGAVGLISMSGSLLNWVLSPYAYSPNKEQMQRFKTALEATFGQGFSAKDYVKSKHLRDLRKCYRTIWSSPNLHSMALYEGPSNSGYKEIRITARHGSFLRRIVHPGWVLTGDFNATQKMRREKLLQHYSSYGEMVHHLNLPHHGADSSFDQKLLNGFPNLISAIAAVGPNSYGHPGNTVQAVIGGMPGIDFVRVDVNPSSLYWVEGRISP